MTAATYTYLPERGLFDLTLLNAESASANFDDIFIEGVQRGMPVELLTRLRGLWETTKAIAVEVIAIGKIIVQKIFEFLKQNPKLTLGIALGAAVGVLIAGIPLIGSLLAPIATLITTLYGAAVGTTMDAGQASASFTDAAFALADKFFELLKMIFSSIAEYWTA